MQNEITVDAMQAEMKRVTGILLTYIPNAVATESGPAYRMVELKQRTARGDNYIVSRLFLIGRASTGAIRIEWRTSQRRGGLKTYTNMSLKNLKKIAFDFVSYFMGQVEADRLRYERISVIDDRQDVIQAIVEPHGLKQSFFSRGTWSSHDQQIVVTYVNDSLEGLVHADVKLMSLTMSELDRVLKLVKEMRERNTMPQVS